MFEIRESEKSPLVDFYGNDHKHNQSSWPPENHSIPKLEEKKQLAGAKIETATAGW